MDTTSFLIESSAIDGKWEQPTHFLLQEVDKFLSLTELEFKNVWDLANLFDDKIEIHAQKRGMLSNMLEWLPTDLKPTEAHKYFMALNLFTSHNGMIGRILWLWHMKKIGRRVNLPFLHHFYFEECGVGSAP